MFIVIENNNEFIAEYLDAYFPDNLLHLLPLKYNILILDIANMYLDFCYLYVVLHVYFHVLQY